MTVPVSIVTGALGVGKTTALLDALARRPAGSRWAVLVNEFGEVGVDGPVLSAAGVAVREVAGGCVCCTAGLELGVAITRLLRDVRPDRLLIEPSGAARPSAVIDALRRPGLAEHIRRNATITLVDPARFAGGRSNDTWDDQVAAADVLVANRADATSPGALDAFRRVAASLWPPKLAIAETSFGRLDLGWFDLAPSAAWRVEAPADHRPDVEGNGWIWPADTSFDRPRLEAALQWIATPGDHAPAGIARIKGLFRVARATLEVHGVSGELRFSPSAWRRDSRVEVLAPTGSGTDFTAILAALEGARLLPPG